MVESLFLSATAFLPRRSLVCGGDLICSIEPAHRARCSRSLHQSMRRFSCRATANGGPGRDRTGDLIVANDALSQLSYRPTYIKKNSAQHTKLPTLLGTSRARTDDLIVANDALSQLSYSPTEVFLLS